MPKYLVYSRDMVPFPGQTRPLRLTPERIRQLFMGDEARKATFLAYADAGYIGIAAEDHGEWLSYGWLSPPHLAPPHLPRSIQSHWWVFGCHTRESYRGRGWYQHTLRALCGLAWDEDPASKSLYIDVLVGNQPALSAVISSGFRPEGSVFVLRIPLVGRVGLYRAAGRAALVR